MRGRIPLARARPPRPSDEEQWDPSRSRFLEPVPTDQWGPEPYNDRGLVQRVSDEIRGRIQDELYDMLAKRQSVWF